jgi:hypothetical protein
MRNTLLIVGLVLVLVIVGLVVWNPFFYFFGNVVNAQSLIVIAVAPLTLGIGIGFLLGLRTGRRRALPKPMSDNQTPVQQR